MSKNTINLQTPQSKFFELSSNYYSKMEIDSETWTSVTQYTYANSIPMDFFKYKIKSELNDINISSNVLGIINTEDPYYVFEKNTQLYRNSIISRSLEKGLSIKLQNKDVMKKLLSTGDKVIRFSTQDDPVLGITDLGSGEGKGENLVGKYLMQIRDFYRRLSEKKKEEEQEKKRLKNYFEAYVVYNFFKNEMMAGRSGLDNVQKIYNLSTIVSTYITDRKDKDLTFSESVELSMMQRLDKYRKPEEYTDNDPEILKRKLYIAMDDIKELENFSELWKAKDQSVYPMMRYFADQPHYMILELRKKYLDIYKSAVERRVKDIIFDLYLDYIINLNYPNVLSSQYKLAKKQQLAKVSWKEYEEMKEQLYLNRDELPSDFISLVNSKLKNVYIPTEEDVSSAKSFDSNLLVPVEFEIEPVSFPNSETYYSATIDITYDINKEGKKSFSTVPWSIEKNSIVMLSPYTYTGTLVIDGISYPSVMHYVVSRLLSDIPSVADPLSYMYESENSFYNYEQIYNKYMNAYRLYQQNSLIYNMKKATDVKFKKIKFYNNLLESGSRKLVWNSPDTVLGTGLNGRGKNETGIYLQEMRKQFISDISSENLLIITNENIWDTIKSDDFIVSWFQKKIKDILNTSRKLIKYSSEKNSLKIPLSLRLVEFVVTRFYYSCNQFEIFSQYISEEVPLFFLELGKKELRTSKNLALISSFLWKKLSAVIYYIILVESKYNSGNLSKLGDRPVSLYALKNLIRDAEATLSAPLIQCDIFQPELEIGENLDINCILSALLNILESILEYNKDSENMELIQVERPGGLQLNIGNREIQLASSIILNTSQELEIPKEDILVDLTFADSGNEEDMERDGAGGYDYSFDIKDLEKYIKSKNLFQSVNKMTNKVTSYVTDYSTFSKNIYSAIVFISNYKMDNKIKRNRINFFAK